MQSSTWAVALQLCILTSLTVAWASNVLFFSVFASRSHIYVLDPVAAELGRRGHQVVFITSVRDLKDPPNVKHIWIPETETIMHDDVLSFFRGALTSNEYEDALISSVSRLVNASFANPYFGDLVRHPIDGKTKRPKFDLVVIDPCFNQYAFVLSHLMDIPTVYISTTHLPPQVAWSLNIPYPLSYVPTGYQNMSTVMTFWERILNLVEYTTYVHSFVPRLNARVDGLITAHGVPDFPGVTAVEHQVSFAMSNDFPSLTPAMPTMPYHVKLGGLHIDPIVHPLPKDLEDFMQSSGDRGVVYFSLGSYTKGVTMPSTMKQKVINAFARIPYKVLWKYESTIEGVSDNVNVVPWVPQQDLLGHPKLKLFITHGGLLSLEEAAARACPILGFPLSADQLGNLASAIHRGFAYSLDWTTFTAEELSEAIILLIEDKKFKLNAEKMSTLFRDRPQRPVDLAAYWIEYVIRHGGAVHLRSGADFLNVIQYFLLDIIGLLAIIVMTAAASLIWTCRKAYGLMNRRRASKLEGTKRNGKQKKH